MMQNVKLGFHLTVSGVVIVFSLTVVYLPGGHHLHGCQRLATEPDRPVPADADVVRVGRGQIPVVGDHLLGHGLREVAPRR